MSNQLLINGTSLTLTPSTVQVHQPVTAIGGSGGAGPVSINYAELLALKVNNGLVIDRTYLVTNRPATNLGETGNILVKAVSVSELEQEAVLCAKVPDYVGLKFWDNGSSVPAGAYTKVISAYTPIVPTGTVTTALSGDDALVRYALPTGFDFKFGGVAYSTIGIDTNGRASFTAITYGYGRGQLPTATPPSEPMIALAFEDLFPTPGQITYFTEGVAPNRKFIIAYTGVPFYGIPATITGQIILEETTYVVTIGISAVTGSPRGVTQGIQFAGFFDNLRANGTMVVNQKGTYSPPSTVLVSRVNATTVIWNGITWSTTTGDLQTPGVDPIWTVAQGDLNFGNTVSVYDEVRYSLSDDTIAERRDKAGNIVTNSLLRNFPWGSPLFSGNLLDTLIIDNSLLNTKGTFRSNKLIKVNIQNLNFNTIDFSSNSLYFVSINTYAPIAFSGNTVFYYLNIGITSYVSRFIVNGTDISSVGITLGLMQNQTSTLQNQVSALPPSMFQFGTGGSGSIIKNFNNNIASAYQSGVLAAESGTAAGQYSTIFSGYQNTTYAHWSSIIGGRNNTINAPDASNQSFSVIMGSSYCAINANRCGIYNSYGCSIANGCDNTILISCTSLNVTAGSNQMYINNQLYAPITLTPPDVKTTLTNGIFTNGIFSGTNPASSKSGMVFTGGSSGNSNTYKYEYTLAPSDTTGTTFAWCRTMLS